MLLSRRIQPLQARDHPIWMYSGPEDTTGAHPEEVSEETVAQWLQSITGNKENTHGAKGILPFHSEHLPGEAFTNMYSLVPNGEPHHGESEGNNDFEYADDNSDDVSDDSNDDEEVEPPPCSERRSKQTRDPAADHGKATASSAKTLKHARTTTPEPSEKVAKKGCHFWSIPYGC
ncbi:hypothetical protein VPH35_009909 [Triticum aestivum]